MSEFLDRFMPALTGAEFKIASYLCGQLEKQAVVDTTITALSRATGVSWRHTQACLQSLAKAGVLLVYSRKGHGIECLLPGRHVHPIRSVSSSQPRAGNIKSGLRFTSMRFQGRCRKTTCQAPWPDKGSEVRADMGCLCSIVRPSSFLNLSARAGH